MTEPSPFKVPPVIARDEDKPPDLSSTDVRKLLVIVDGAPEARVAALYACRRALATGARVTLMAVVEPIDFQHWAAVADRMQEEAYAVARAQVYEMASIVVQVTGQLAEFVICKGGAFDQIVALVREEPEIRMLVLAASAESDGPGPLVSRLVGAGGSFPRPVTIVPANLTDEEIEALD